VPSCAARAARPENLRFYYSTEAAQAAGLRACKRCQPLSALTEQQTLIDLANYLTQQSTTPQSLSALAHRTGLSASRLQKKFTALFGVSPKAWQDGKRLEQFKTELGNQQTITAAMHAAGYGSSSRLYGRTAKQLGMSPKAYRAGAAGETIHYAHGVTSFGPLLMAATAHGVCFVQFGTSPQELVAQLGDEFPNANIELSSASGSKVLEEWLSALNEHLEDNAPRPDLPLDIRGTAFQLKVWKFLLSIPTGDRVSYADLAQAIDQPKAFRAAASACGANRIAVLIPCHRVLRGDGSMGGYRWGIDRKRRLLETEALQC